jgi:Zn-dependent protease
MNAGLNSSNLPIIAVVILLSMGLHESMHGFVAHWLGDPTAKEAGRLTLNPLKHVDIITTVLLPVILIAVGLPPIFAAKPVPFNPSRVKYAEFGAALIGVAGPLTNLALAVAGAGLAHLLIDANTTTWFLNVLIIFVQVNVGFFVFNMLPIPPLDGSRLLYAVAPEPVQEVMARFESLGIGAVILILVVLMPFIGPVIINLNNAVLRVLL